MGLALALGSLQPANAADECSSDACDGFRWQTARGASNENSYWGMDPGHNCTNYVAWKLITNRVMRPMTNPGNASTWAERAATDGYRVDSVASVGAVAQWGAYEGGYGYDGHVAYVERVNGDGTVLISEDYWHGGDQLGPLTFRTVTVSSVSRFIHYGDLPSGLRMVLPAAGTWTERATGIPDKPDLISAVNMGAAAPEVLTVAGGALYDATLSGRNWQYTGTGVEIAARSLSAVNMGAVTPVVVALEGSHLVLVDNSGAGWMKSDTGVSVSGEMVAVNAGGSAPTVLVSQGGSLYRVWKSQTGWQAESTGIELTGRLTAVGTNGSEVEVFSVSGGMLQRSWSQAGAWYTVTTGLPIDGPMSAASIDGTAQLLLVEGGMIYAVYQDPLGWHKRSTGVSAGGSLSAVDVGGMYPAAFQTD